MGLMKRRVMEKARQNLGLSMDRGFKPTSNSRLASTFAETKKFADELRKFDKYTVAQLKAIKEYNMHAASFLRVVLPRMHKEVDGTSAPIDTETHVGAQVDLEKLERAAEEGDAQIFKYVQEPLRKWLANFDTVVDQQCDGSHPEQLAMRSVESLRLTVDSRRRTLSSLEGKLTAQQAKAREEDDQKIQKLTEKKHRQEMKLAQVQEDFSRKELQTYQNMRHLVNDVKYVQQHIHKLFDLIRHIFGDVCDAFPVTNPLPSEGRDSGAYPHSDGHLQYTTDSTPLAPEHGPDGGPEQLEIDESHEDFGNRMDGFSSSMRKAPSTKHHKDRYADHSAGLHQSTGFQVV